MTEVLPGEVTIKDVPELPKEKYGSDPSPPEVTSGVTDQIETGKPEVQITDKQPKKTDAIQQPELFDVIDMLQQNPELVRQLLLVLIMKYEEEEDKAKKKMLLKLLIESMKLFFTNLIVSPATEDEVKEHKPELFSNLILTEGKVA